MNTEELSNRLTQILTGITSGEPNPNIIQGFVQNFSKTSTYTLNENIANTNPNCPGLTKVPGLFYVHT